MLKDPDSKVKQREEGKAFPREGPMVAKDLVWAMVVPTRRTKRISQSKEQSGRCEVADKGEFPKIFWSDTSIAYQGTNH